MDRSYDQNLDYQSLDSSFSSMQINSSTNASTGYEEKYSNSSDPYAQSTAWDNMPYSYPRYDTLQDSSYPVEARAMNISRAITTKTVTETSKFQLHVSFVTHNMEIAVDHHQIMATILSCAPTAYNLIIKQQKVDPLHASQSGYGFVSFPSMQDCIDCMDKLKHLTVNGITYDCSLARRSTDPNMYKNKIPGVNIGGMVGGMGMGIGGNGIGAMGAGGDGGYNSPYSMGGYPGQTSYDRGGFNAYSAATRGYAPHPAPAHGPLPPSYSSYSARNPPRNFPPSYPAPRGSPILRTYPPYSSYPAREYPPSYPPATPSAYSPAGREYPPKEYEREYEREYGRDYEREYREREYASRSAAPSHPPSYPSAYPPSYPPSYSNPPSAAQPHAQAPAYSSRELNYPPSQASSQPPSYLSYGGEKPYPPPLLHQPPRGGESYERRREEDRPYPPPLQHFSSASAIPSPALREGVYKHFSMEREDFNPSFDPPYHPSLSAPLNDPHYLSSALPPSFPPGLLMNSLNLEEEKSSLSSSLSPFISSALSSPPLSSLPSAPSLSIPSYVIPNPLKEREEEREKAEDPSSSRPSPPPSLSTPSLSAAPLSTLPTFFDPSPHQDNVTFEDLEGEAEQEGGADREGSPQSRDYF